MGYVRRAMENDVLNFLGDLVREARARGADEVDAVDIDSRSLDAAVRLGKIEHMERSELRKTGLRVLVGCRQAVVASADRQRETASGLVERAVAMA
ncbi:MAG: TldD/PmbA family protein, partial [Alphaproteobacteria bacterium]|nr:TldD/PmbA family protein [Alphaproteobacteria bacterium]